MEAAGMTKIPKRERRIMAKQLKSRKTLFRHENIICSDFPTKHLVVANGGLGNDVELRELWTVFSPYGQIVDIVMKPRKPFAFVSFSKEQEAVDAVAGVHGRVLQHPEELSRVNVTFYLSYVETIPDVSSYPNDDALPSDLVIMKDFVSEDYEQQLLNAVSWQQDQADAEESLKHRRVKHFGYRFMYNTNDVDRDHPLDEKIPEQCYDLLHDLLRRNIISRMPDQLTVNQYNPGQGIPPHVDTHSAFEDEIIILSLESQIVMDFCHPAGRQVPVLLPRRSVAVLSGESRYLWTHGITPRKSDIVKATELSAVDAKQPRLTLWKRGRRTSFTFRTVRLVPCNCNYMMQCDSQIETEKFSNVKHSVDPFLPTSIEEALRLESLHVHQVYEEIAHHFSSTRHTPWPRVVTFLEQLPINSIVADVGCGNGKYLGVVPDRFMIGCDRSASLCDICRLKGKCILVCDGLSLPFRDTMFDAVICIAVIHHISTQERRIKALSEIARILSPNGLALVYVWALEQERDGIKSKYLKDSSEVEIEEVISSPSSISERNVSFIPTNSHNSLDVKIPVHTNRTPFRSQDLLVPWHAKGEKRNSKMQQNKLQDCSSETNERNSQAVVSKPLTEEWSFSSTPTPFLPSQQNVSADSVLAKVCNGNVTVPEHSETFHRYYHVFQSGELENLCTMVPSLSVVESYYDQGNWCVIVERKPNLE